MVGDSINDALPRAANAGLPLLVSFGYTEDAGARAGRTIWSIHSFQDVPACIALLASCGA
jgi:phosphoglycolate phosphatase-like HAD superfamily hydrolase